MNTLKKFALLAMLPVILILSGCAIGGTNHTDGKAITANAPEETVVNPLQKLLGEVITYDDGLSVSVSTPAVYTPSAQAAGVDVGATNLVFNVVITNNSKDNVDISGFPSLNSGGVAASSISDLGNDIGITPNTTLLPGQSITFQDAYSVKDENDLTYFITPGFEYEQAIFTNK